MASFSSLCRNLGCERKALLAMEYKNIKPKTEALIFGSAYHHSLEEGIKAGIADLEREGLNDKVPLLIDMVGRANKFFLENNIKITEHEVPFDIAIKGLKEHFIGFIDGIADWNRDTWLVEFKTSAFIKVDHVPIDSQITAYIWACRKMGICNPKGVLYIVNKKTLEKEPTVLANGGLSTAKTQGCTLESYINKANEIYGDDIPAKVELFIDWLRENEKPPLVCVASKRTEDELERFEYTLFENIKKQEEIQDKFSELGLEGALSITPCFPNKFCFDSCDYKEECLRLMKGVDEVADID